MLWIDVPVEELYRSWFVVDNLNVGREVRLQVMVQQSTQHFLHVYRCGGNLDERLFEQVTSVVLVALAIPRSMLVRRHPSSSHSGSVAELRRARLRCDKGGKSRGCRSGSCLFGY